MKRLVLVGGGHAHLFVLQALAREKLTNIEVVLVIPSFVQNYSGMLPGWMAGHYAQTQCQIDLQPLARSAHVHMVIDRVISLGPDRHRIGLSDGRHIEYDVLSMDTGSEVDVSWLEMAGKKLLPVKPLEAFFQAWPRILSDALDNPGYCLAVVGGGAAATELALAARYALVHSGANRRVDLVASESGPLVGHAASVQRRIAHFLSTAGVVVHKLRGVGANEGVLLSDGTLLVADCVIAATGARAPCWLALSGLTLSESEYIAVDRHYRSISHPDVFAAGDVCERQDIVSARSGVHAVRAGPVLAKNLLAALQGGVMQTVRFHPHSLYLLACGPRYAVASWGRWSAEGRWVWCLKDWIDQRFIRKFSDPKRPRVAVSETEI